MISQELLEELQVILKQDYAIELPEQDLLAIANTLITYYEILLKSNSEGNN